MPTKLSLDYQEGYDLATKHAFGDFTHPLASHRDPDYYRGYEVASIRLTGGHSVRYADADTVDLHRETVVQLESLLSRMNEDPEALIGYGTEVNAILPHLKLALGEERTAWNTDPERMEP